MTGYGTAQAALRRYAQVGIRSAVDDANPHRIIALLLDGVLARLGSAVGHMKRGDIGSKGEDLGLAITIIGGLQSSLDLERGGEVAVNLNRLYDYMTRTLLSANLDDDVARVEHVQGLVSEIKAGWDAIASVETGAA